MVKYKVVNGTYYDALTPKEVIDNLEHARQHDLRIRLHYGDRETGRDWGDDYGMTGRVGRSMGPVKIPILLYNRRSLGGCGILDNRIVKIEKAAGGRVLYQQPNYFDPQSAEFELHQLEECEDIIYRANREVI